MNEDINQMLEIPAPPVSATVQRPVPIPESLGGWLILPAIGLVLGCIMSLVGIVASLGLSANLPSRYQGIFALSLIFDIGLTIFLVYAAVRFFGKRRNAPATMIALLIVQLVVNALLLAISLGSNAEPFAVAAGVQLLRSIIPALIWIPYFSVSQRVKRTFVVP